MLIRKVIVALLTGATIMTIFFLLSGFGFGLFIGMYLVPILILYGIPTSLLADIITKTLQGYKRVCASLLIHTFMGILFGIAPSILNEGMNGLISVFSVFSFFSAFLFWVIDEWIRSGKWRCGVCSKVLMKMKGVLHRIGELRI